MKTAPGPKHGARRGSGEKRRGLGGLAARALGWSFLNTALTKLGLTGFGVLLARILGPQQYGTVAVAMTVLLAVLSFNELGVSLAIVRWPEDPRDIAPTVATISVASSVMLYVAVFFAAPSLAAAMDSPASVPVIRVMALLIIINGIASIPSAILQRNFRQGHQMIADQAHGWLGVAVSVALALQGFGAMSLAIGQVCAAITGGILMLIFSPVPFRFGFDREQARKLLKFGLPLAGSSIVVFLVGNVDNFIVGHELGPRELGFYVLAWNVASLPVNLFSQPVRGVAPALFSRLQGNPRAMRTGFSSLAALLGAITLPVCFTMGGCALPLVTFIYGAGWNVAAQPLLWLAVLAALRIIFELSYDYFVVLAKARVVLTVQIAWFAILVPALIAGVHFAGIRGAAIMGFAVAAAVVLPCYIYELAHVGIRIMPLARRFGLSLILAVMLGAAASGITHVLRNDLGVIACSGILGLFVIAFLGYTMRRQLGELRRVMSDQDEGESADARGAIDQSEPDAGRPAQAAVGAGPGREDSFPGWAALTGWGASGVAAYRPVAPTVPFRVVVPQAPEDKAAAPPIYRDMVTSFGWDPMRRTFSDVPADIQEKNPPLQEAE